MKKLLLATVLFCISYVASMGQSITMTTPNGGEVWSGCTVQNITWSAVGTDSHKQFNIDYSTNNGTSWTSVASFYNTVTNTFAWTVPNTQSSNCLVRVTDAYVPATFGKSAAVFTINAAVILTAPNGGETWQGGTTNAINWASSGTSNYYTIDYSTNAGSSWTNIVTNKNIVSNTYNWAVPNTPSSSCLVRIADANSACKTYTSTNLFTITPATPVITLVAPNGGENYVANTKNTISWNCNYLSSTNVKLEYSTNSGTTWTTIIASTPTNATSGNYLWTVPNTPSTTCLIRASDFGNASTNSVCSAVFTISPPYVTITAPIGGENWLNCGQYNITWTAAGTSGINKIEYSTNAGTTWTTLATAASGGNYSWTIPGTVVASTTCLVRISDASVTTINSTSPAAFAISKPLTITAPIGGETWQGGTTNTIIWTTLNPFNSYTCDYSINGGTSWINIFTNRYYSTAATSLTYSWLTPNTPSTNCLIRIYDYNTSCRTSTSPASFTISPATPVLTLATPVGGEKYTANTSNLISWNCNYLSATNVKLEYSTNSGTSWTTIIASTPTNATNGFYNWMVPNTPSTTCLVRVSDFGNAATNSVSPAVFTISPPYITLTYPVGGESWLDCSQYNITWNSAGTSANNKIEYSTNSGTSWTTITTSATGNNYYWTLPSTVPASTTCLIRVSDASATTINSTSAAVFTIQTPLTLQSPIGGETWQGGTTKTITWTSLNPNRTYTYDYSINNGVSWINIGSAYMVGSSLSYSWLVPNTPSSNCLVRITDYYTPCRTITSPAVFTITPATPIITLAAPVGGENYTGNTANLISWNCKYLSSTNVKLEYSTNSGTSWNTIVGATPTNATNGSYNWTVPNTPSTTCLVRASDYGNAATNSMSPATFTISPPYITITSPVGGENWMNCNQYNITWTAAGTSGLYKIEYSTDGGSTYSTLTTSSTSYLWTIPNTVSNSSNCFVRVSDAGNLSITSKNASPFSIGLPLTVAAPIGVETWQVGTTNTITWTALNPFNSYTCDYSINGGTSWINVFTNRYYATAATNLTYSWLTPNTPSTNCLIRIYDTNTPCRTNTSPAAFTISPATSTIALTAPIGGEVLFQGATSTITWNNSYVTNVKLEYSTNSGSSWTTITSNTPTGTNFGTYNWTVPAIASNFCLIRVSDASNASLNSVSPAVFSIVPDISLTSPNGGENWASCTVTSITWTAGNTSSYYNIYYSLNGGTTWTSIASAYYNNTQSASYTWNIPALSSTNCLVKVTDYYASSKTSTSIAKFTISPSISLTYPNFGGVLTVGSAQNITWSTTSGSNFYNIDYSINGGTSWVNIVFNYNTTLGTYAWTVPNAPSTNCLIRVTDNISACKTGQSKTAFTISATAAAITVTSPNGAENWASCSSQNITWTSSGTSGAYNIDYSTNGGTTWTNLVTNSSISTGTYNWTSLPSLNSTNCLVRVTDFAAATKTDASNAAFTITGPIANAGSNVAICNGSSTTLAGSGGVSYSWSPATGLSATNISNPVASPSTTTTYTLTVTDALGCTNAATVTVTVNPIPVVTATVGSASICAGASTSLSAGGANSYLWSPATGLNTTTTGSPFASPTATITYTVTGTSNGCSATATSTITVNSLPTITTSGNATTCQNSAVPLTASGAVTYAWTPTTGLSNAAIANPNATVSANTTYTVKGTDANGCSQTSNLTITTTPSPVITITGNTLVCAGASTTITAAGANTYSWSPATGLSNASTANPVATPTATTTYTVTGTTGPCSSSQSIILTVNPLPVVTASGSATICAGASTPLSASGATNYSWSPSGLVSNAGIVNPQANPPATTSYTVTGTTNGCSNTATTVITVNPLPTVSATGGGTFCAGTSAPLSAGGASSYSWLPVTGLDNAAIATPNATPASTITYTVTGTDVNGCKNTASTTVTITPIPVLTIAGTSTICAGASTTLTASGATTYSWSPATGLSNAAIANPVASPAATTTYTVTGTTGACTSTKTIVVTVNSIPVVAIAGANPICSGTSETLTASGATTYSWSPATGLSSTTSATPVASPAATATYTVTGTTSGCSATATATVTVNTTPTVTATGTATICSGASTPLAASGATSYAWTPAGSLTNAALANPTATPAATTTYTVTGTTGSCSNTATVVVTVNATPTVTAGGTTTICAGVSTGLTASGATSYSWSPTTGLSSVTSATPTANPASTTTYTVVGTTSGCASAPASVTVMVNPLPTVTASGGATACAGTPVPLTAGGASTYSWSPVAGLDIPTSATPNASPTTTTLYTVTGTDVNGCKNTASTTVTITPIPVLNIAGTNTICAGASTTLTASGATTYSWSPATGLSNAAIANPVASPAATTTYTVTGTTGACTGTKTIAVTVNAVPPTPAITQTGFVLNSSATTGNQWFLNGSAIAGATSSSYTPSAVGSYKVSVTNAATCLSMSAAFSYTVTGLVNQNLSNGIRVYPNPSEGKINLEIVDNGACVVTVTDILGKVIFSQQLDAATSSQVKSLEINELPEGSYFLQVKTPTDSFMKKIIVM
jgi:hypothetical protein